MKNASPNFKKSEEFQGISSLFLDQGDRNPKIFPAAASIIYATYPSFIPGVEAPCRCFFRRYSSGLQPLISRKLLAK